MTYKRWLWAVILLALVLRLGTALVLGDTLEGPEQVRIYDQVSYHALAQSLLAGRGYSFVKSWYPFTPAYTPTAHWSFLYPLYLAGVYLLFGIHPLAARLVQAVISAVLGTWLTYRLGKKLFGERVGLLAGLLSSVYIYLFFHDAALMTESFFTLGVLAIMNVTLSLAGADPSALPAARFKRFAPWLGLGLILGLTAVLRQTILLWIPFLFGWLLWSRGWKTWKESLLGFSLTSLVVLLCILPWTIRNWITYQAFLPLNSNSGFAIYSSNHPNQGVHFDQDYVAPLPQDLDWAVMNEARLNDELTKRGIGFILADPIRYLQLSWSRVGIFFNFWFSPGSRLLSNLMRVLSFGLYLPFFLIGIVRSIPFRQKASLIWLFALMFSALHIFTWASVRYRLPIDAALMPFAALALFFLASKIPFLSKKLPLGRNPLTGDYS